MPETFPGDSFQPVSCHRAPDPLFGYRETEARVPQAVAAIQNGEKSVTRASRPPENGIIICWSGEAVGPREGSCIDVQIIGIVVWQVSFHTNRGLSEPP